MRTIRKFRDPEEWYSDALKRLIRDGVTRSEAEGVLNEAYDMMTKDSLTGVYNHAMLFKLLSNETKLVGRGKPLCIIMSDLDNFGKYNNTYGHIQGDLALVSVIDAIENGTKKRDIIGRYGGEEFAIILPNTNLEGAIKVAGRIRKNVEDMVIEASSEKFRKGFEKITISQGIAQYRKRTYRDNIEKLFIDADKALYKSKDNGKNCVCVYKNNKFILMPT